ncbi:Protein of uncharacterised function (DUF1198) [Cedecea neteri]|uniref:Protein of uncharacterized function (DUF1198) n=1 Tax=Cedecea neteri TaxID=158822 RepID=A0A2X2T1H9_9ENTR|nr:Protein of uncharacterised function (DUF1198) [Cedecea neteri]
MSPICKNAAQVLLVWQMVIVDGSDRNLQQWYRRLQKARLATPITDAQVRLAQGFLREMEPEKPEITAFQMRYNGYFQPEDACTGCTKTRFCAVITAL